MNLDETQRQKVIGWIGEGLQPAEVQKRLGAEFGLSLTYMEVRLLLTDLDLKPKDKEMPAAPTAQAATIPAAGTGSAGVDDAAGTAPVGDPLDGPPGGGVSVTVDQLTRPGAVVSGKVTFSDGKGAEWYLDQMGRLGLMPKDKGYKPPQADLMEFQTALQDQLAKLGY